MVPPWTEYDHEDATHDRRLDAQYDTNVMPIAAYGLTPKKCNSNRCWLGPVYVVYVVYVVYAVYVVYVVYIVYVVYVVHVLYVE